MATPTPVRLLLALLALVGVAGCGGGKGPTDATPTTVTLTLDFGAVTVIEDCDGIEGDGDFQFEVDVNVTGNPTTDVVYKRNVTLGPGGSTAIIGRHTYTIDLDAGAPGVFPQVSVWFRAVEFDKNILGQTYNDSRLDNDGHGIAHTYNSDLKQWLDLGNESITLGEPGCLVRLNYTAHPG